MKLLLDTHTFIWLNVSPELLSDRALSVCESPDNRLYFSLVSAWEMQIKTQLGKLSLPASWDVLLKRQQDDNELLILPIELAHIKTELPHHHKDPFDRMLISQSQTEDMVLVSKDGAFDAYDVKVLW